ncbi:hypothetical protein BST97_08820 [Nonlabens spongiae]|uniref:Lipocalin-like domain-containing protein n=1 Tax=Nonlabens spongiae TaxID=331648 RepID=A0A1W6MKJ5_9FLAO|nr:hypothetical protein [Nonlabens spongiae]ARN78092.1 hypothetical protein BST97_08820 [Nonlabens spongiae]
MEVLSGIWKGYYEYGLGYDLPYFGERVKIEYHLDFKNFNLTGTTYEEPSEFSVDSKGSIDGFIEDTLVSFTKKYPIYPTVNENGSIELKPGELIVNHTGYYDRERQSIYGLWTINNPDTVNEEYEMQQSEGIWLVSKE